MDNCKEAIAVRHSCKKGKEEEHYYSPYNWIFTTSSLHNFLFVYPFMIESYNRTQRFHVDMRCVNQINYKSLMEKPELLLDYGFYSLDEDELVYGGYPTEEYQKVFQSHDGNGAVQVTVYMKEKQLSTSNVYTVDPYMTVQYKDFFTRLFHKQGYQKFYLELKNAGFLLVFSDPNETEDYPERIYRQIEALAELFPVAS